ncbi:hypothetical protein OH76DRAFT_1417955 [Lentinus brumalis]|uniref:PH domain-containing protein n=1 Tax=Lentinus brumalis TaxID=2498619 RepID=A0A371DCL2_9APHY|nr:hypothetical protein OH76DRAFT_1417955 [Polyporus brumalis]
MSSPPPSSPLMGLSKRARGSLLIPSGISLPFTRTRNKSKKGRPPPATNPFVYSEVIEISAPPPLPPEEDEDRNHLRNAAAQSIGLDPVLLEDRESLSSLSHTRSFSQSQAHTERSMSQSSSRSRSPSPTRSRARGTTSSRAETPATRSLPPFPATQSALSPWVQRASKVAKHYPPTSLLLYALAKQWKPRVLVLTSSPMSGSGPLTHTTSFSSQSQSPHSLHSSSSLPQNVAHLHVFKSDGGGERELERVEIGAESVVFVSEDDIGGRRGVVRVGGVGGAELTLSMADQTEAQNWIAAIKHAVLSERSVQAGLGAMAQSNGVEPRGDLDVMLSMRVQGIFTPPPAAVTSVTVPAVATSHGKTGSAGPSSPAPSLRSASPRPASPRPPSVAVSALRGLFGGHRPRSPSGATLDMSFNSISERDGAETPPPEDSSFGRAGNSLLGMLRSNSVSSERPLSPTTPMSSVPSTPRVGSTTSADLPVQMGLISPLGPPPSLDQKILQDKDRESLLPSLGRDRFSGLGLTGVSGGSLDAHVSKLYANGATPFGAGSLQPPPRRRAYTASGLAPPAHTNGERVDFAYHHTNASAAETLGVRHNGSAFLSPRPTSPALSATASPSPTSPSTTSSPRFSPSPSLSPSLSPNGVGSSPSPPQREGRVSSSWSSVSSLGSGSNEQPPRTSFEAVSKRWSRQGVLPKRLSPPNGPPPATPPSGPAPLPPSSPSGRSSFQQPRHPYAADNSPSRSPSQRSVHSPQSIMSNLQNFSKRASGSSIRSDTTVSTTQSRATGSSFIAQALMQPPSQSSPHVRPRSSHRTSVPPPQRPAPSMALPPTPTADEFGKMDVVPLPAPAPTPTLRSNGYPSRPPHSAPAAKTSFRESFTIRTNRLSLSPPTLPPSAALPPRPDELLSQRRSHHRRSTSSGSPISLPTIPASPNPLVLPAAPTNDPLSLTSTAQPTTPIPITSRPTLLFKRRLRMLSTPSPTPPPLNPLPNVPLNPPSPAPSSINPYSLPSTPIGEPITTFQNDPSFLIVSPSPPLSPMSAVQPPIVSPLLPPPPEQSPEMHGITSLSPPPRRGSRQISVLQMESDSEEEGSDKELEFKLNGSGDSGSPVRKPLSLSPRQSIASLEDVCI